MVNMQTQDQSDIQDISRDVLQEIAKGLLYTHVRINDETSKILEASSFLYALIELLSEKELIAIEDLDERKNQVAERLVRKFVDRGIGLLYQDSENGKYSFGHEADVDCLSRLGACKVICCKFPFALSKQDVNEGIIRWEFARPYLIAHGNDGYCVHLDRETYRCTVREHRPLPCRGFDCHDNEKWRVWLDYGKKIINSALVKESNENVRKFYSFPLDVIEK
jgi:Fe-S-cluster containining protein